MPAEGTRAEEAGGVAMTRVVATRWKLAKAAARRTGSGSVRTHCPCSSCISPDVDVGVWFMHCDSIDYAARGPVLASMILDGIAREDLP